MKHTPISLFLAMVVGFLISCGDAEQPTRQGPTGNSGNTSSTGTPSPNEEPNNPPNNVAPLAAGLYGCELVQEISFDNQGPPPDPPTFVTLTVASVSETTVITYSDEPEALGACSITWNRENNEGVIQEQECDNHDYPWQEGTMTIADGVLSMNLLRVVEHPQTTLTTRSLLTCSPHEEVEDFELTVHVNRTTARIIIGPEPGLTADFINCLAGASPCTLSVPQGWSVEIYSSYNADAPEVTINPASPNACTNVPGRVDCAFTMSGDTSIDIDWPWNGFTKILTVHANGIPTIFAFPLAEEPTIRSCANDCTYEVDSQAEVRATISNTDIDFDISGTGHFCQIVNSSTWSCEFRMTQNRTVTITPDD